jgi:hypothetical protein
MQLKCTLSLKGNGVKLRNLMVFVASLSWLGLAQSFQLIGQSPTGEVARISQVVVRFDEAAIDFGNAQAAAPLDLQCSDPKATQGTGRWLNAKQWVFDFESELPPGLSCTQFASNQASNQPLAQHTDGAFKLQIQ